MVTSLRKTYCLLPLFFFIKLIIFKFSVVSYVCLILVIIYMLMMAVDVFPVDNSKGELITRLYCSVFESYVLSLLTF